ncbi:TetR/AcrR family transcriptional regulator [Streptomyces sp. NPDC087428]|uniref:SbtR family transcriptional regulator n=1 Tax=Streptomyces sp. NPDC087428 TaxID=3365788 RepID=UPI003802E629
MRRLNGGPRRFRFGTIRRAPPLGKRAAGAAHRNPGGGARTGRRADARATTRAFSTSRRRRSPRRLSALTAYVASVRGLATALALDGADRPDAAHVNVCSVKLTDAADPLLVRATRDGAVTPGVSVADLLALIAGIAPATEHHKDSAAEADRLLGLTIAGVGPQR